MRPQVMASQCDTCIFHAGNRMQLADGRLAEIVATNLNEGAALICHKTLPYGEHPEMGEAVCRGFWDAYGDRTRSIQTMRTLFGWAIFEEVEPPAQHATTSKKLDS